MGASEERHAEENTYTRHDHRGESNVEVMVVALETVLLAVVVTKLPRVIGKQRAKNVRANITCTNTCVTACIPTYLKRTAQHEFVDTQCLAVSVSSTYVRHACLQRRKT